MTRKPRHMDQNLFVKSFLFAVQLFLLIGICCAFSPPVDKKIQVHSPESLSFSSWRYFAKMGVNTSSFGHGSVLSLQNENDNDSSSFYPSLSSPLDRPVLATLDVLSLLVFSAIGKASHAPDGSIDVLGVMGTAFPFVFAWLTTSPLTGVYSTDPTPDGDIMKSTLQQVAKGWIVAIPLGCFLRGVIKGYAPPIPFVIVTLVSTLVITGFARVAFATMENFLSKPST